MRLNNVGWWGKREREEMKRNFVCHFSNATHVMWLCNIICLLLKAHKLYSRRSAHMDGSDSPTMDGTKGSKRLRREVELRLWRFFFFSSLFFRWMRRRKEKLLKSWNLSHWKLARTEPHRSSGWLCFFFDGVDDKCRSQKWNCFSVFTGDITIFWCKLNVHHIINTERLLISVHFHS